MGGSRLSKVNQTMQVLLGFSRRLGSSKFHQFLHVLTIFSKAPKSSSKFLQLPPKCSRYLQIFPVPNPPGTKGSSMCLWVPKSFTWFLPVPPGFFTLLKVSLNSYRLFPVPPGSPKVTPGSLSSEWFHQVPPDFSALL